MRTIKATSRFPRLLLLAAAVLTGICVPTRNARAGVSIGVGTDTEVQGSKSVVLSLSYLTEQRFPWEFAIGRFGEHRSRFGVRIAPTTYYAAISKRLTWHHLFVSEGLVYDNADDYVLSGHFQAQTSVGLQFPHVAFSIRHMSNANTSGVNHGETFALVQYQF